MLLGFGAPIVDPIAPEPFKLEQVKFDPSAFEKNPDTAAPMAATNIDLNPNEVAAFDGPLDAPRITAPSIQMDREIPLSADTPVVIGEAFSTMELEKPGNIPQVAQSLVDEAATAAKPGGAHGIGKYLVGGGSDERSADGVGRIPEFTDVANLVNVPLRDGDIAKPKQQPIYLRFESDQHFAFDSDELRIEGTKELSLLADYLRGAEEIHIVVEGHADTLGDPKYNQQLSERRAQAVADWLVANSGLSATSFEVRGYGSQRPLVISPKTLTFKERTKIEASNRRVEVRIEGKK